MRLHEVPSEVASIKAKMLELLKERFVNSHRFKIADGCIWEQPLSATDAPWIKSSEDFWERTFKKENLL